MTPTADLKGHFAGLADEDLVAQLAEGRLTHQASTLAREELVSRGVNVDLAFSKVRSDELDTRQAQDQKNGGFRYAGLFAFHFARCLGSSLLGWFSSSAP
jgi:hypothetical protein